MKESRHHRGGRRTRTAKLRFASVVEASSSRVVIHIVHHYEIQPAIAVVIEERRHHRPRGIVDDGGLGDLSERAVAVIHEKVRPDIFSNEHIGPTVVVDVADGNAHAIARDVQARANAHVAEMSIGFLMIEPVRLS